MTSGRVFDFIISLSLLLFQLLPFFSLFSVTSFHFSHEASSCLLPQVIPPLFVSDPPAHLNLLLAGTTWSEQQHPPPPSPLESPGSFLLSAAAAAPAV